MRHTPLPERSQVLPVSNGVYLDLFSPVKPDQPKAEDTNERQVAGPCRARPRISSQTFVKSPQPAAAAEDISIASPRNIGLFPSTDDTDDDISPNDTTIPPKPRPMPASPHQRLTWRP